MKRLQNWINTAWITFVIGGVFTFLSSIVASIDQLDSLQYSVMDFDFTDILYSKMLTDSLVVQDTNVVIVNIGNLDRNGIAKQINRINAQKPKVIGVDVFFEVDRGAENDSNLVNALKNVPSLVVGSRVTEGKEDENGEIIWEGTQTSHAKFIFPSTKIGFLSMITEKNDAKESARLFVTQEKIMNRQKPEYSFAFEVAFQYDSTKALKLLERNNVVEIIDYKGGANILNIQAPKRFQIVDADEVLDTAQDLRFMKNKIVLLGFFGGNLGQLAFEDLYFTPMNPYYVGRSFPDSYGIIIHANIISQILEERYIDALPEKLDWLLNFLLLCAFTGLLAYFYEHYPNHYAIFSKISAFLGINFLLFLSLFFYKYFSFKFDFRVALFYLVFLPDGYEYYHRYLLPNFYWLLKRIKK